MVGLSSARQALRMAIITALPVGDVELRLYSRLPSRGKLFLPHLYTNDIQLLMKQNLHRHEIDRCTMWK